MIGRPIALRVPGVERHAAARLLTHAAFLTPAALVSAGMLSATMRPALAEGSAVLGSASAPVRLARQAPPRPARPEERNVQACGVGTASGIRTAACREAEPRLKGWEALDAAAEMPASRTAEAERLRAMETWNLEGHLPLQVGIVRRLEAPLQVVLDGSALDIARQGRPAVFAGGRVMEDRDGGLIWTARVRVEEARELRLHVASSALPRGAEMRSYGRSGRAFLGPDVEDAPNVEDDSSSSDSNRRGSTRESVAYGAGIWMPTVEGPDAWLEVRLPAAALRSGRTARVTIDEILEVFRLDSRGRSQLGQDMGRVAFEREGEAANRIENDSCLTDLRCGPDSDAISNAAHAVGRMLFVIGDGGYACTGGLLNDSMNSGTPYFLTAHHCMHSQAVASTLEVTWDFRTLGCGRETPATDSLPKSRGATLLATSEETDFTLIKLKNIPDGRAFLGWSTDFPTTSTLLQRISHPGGGPQVYSESHSNDGSPGTCGEVPLSNFVYETASYGGIAEGSSGSPVWHSEGIVVGQLLGLCGPNPADNCLSSNSQVDGRFSASFPLISSWLDPAPPAVPTELQILKLKKKKVVLGWFDGVDDHDHFEVLVNLPTGWEMIKRRGKRATGVSLGGLTPATTYELGVRACDGLVCSEMATTTATTTE